VIDESAEGETLHAAVLRETKDDCEKIIPKIVQLIRMHLLFRFVVTEAPVAGALYFGPSTLSSFRNRPAVYPIF
jgi:hypothetical protein